MKRQLSAALVVVAITAGPTAPRDAYGTEGSGDILCVANCVAGTAIWILAGGPNPEAFLEGCLTGCSFGW